MTRCLTLDEAKARWAATIADEEGDVEEEDDDVEDDDGEDDDEEDEEEDDDDDEEEYFHGHDDESHGGPTEYARSQVRDMLSSFMLYFPRDLEESVIAMTNLEASRRDPPIAGWRAMGPAEFRAYLGLLLLSGVYRSRGEACESLWDAENGRSVFRATMPLKVFRAYCSALRFDDRETRRETASPRDKLAPIRRVWELWCLRLPLLYLPGREITVDERLVPFRGRCPFRQYMPSKPARYGIKIWVACDAESSYAWNMQVYTGKSDKRAPPEQDLATRVVMDLARGLPPARNITCDNFFTSQALGDLLWNEGHHTLLGTIRKNRREIPGELRCVKGRSVGSVVAVRTRSVSGAPETELISYVPKKNKNVLLLTTCPEHTRVANSPPPSVQQQQQQRQREDRVASKPAMVLHYNRTKGGVDNLDKVVATYSCRRKTCRWPVALFHNMVDVAGYNAFVLWRELRPEWMQGKRNRRRVFLESVGHALVAPIREARSRSSSSSSSSATAAARTLAPERHQAHGGPAPRRRCSLCPRLKDVKTRTVCHGCERYVCCRCALTYCPNCAGLASPPRA